MLSVIQGQFGNYPNEEFFYQRINLNETHSRSGEKINRMSVKTLINISVWHSILYLSISKVWCWGKLRRIFSILSCHLITSFKQVNLSFYWIWIQWPFLGLQHPRLLFTMQRRQTRKCLLNNFTHLYLHSPRSILYFVTN